jgi:hypothetical protein
MLFQSLFIFDVVFWEMDVISAIELTFNTVYSKGKKHDDAASISLCMCFLCGLTPQFILV